MGPYAHGVINPANRGSESPGQASGSSLLVLLVDSGFRRNDGRRLRILNERFDATASGGIRDRTCEIVYV